MSGVLAATLSTPASAVDRPLEIADRAELGSPGPGEVSISVAACGVCRTDLQLCEGDLAPRRLPIVPGHQIVGRVVALGAGVTTVGVGDRVGVTWLAGACGTCHYCKTGRENLCPQATFTGWDRDGGFARSVTADAGFVHLLAGGGDDVALAPLLCGGVIGYRSLRLSGIEDGGRLGLFGFGASATIVIQLAVARDIDVFVVTRSERERSRAERLGAVWTGGYDDPPPVPLDAAITTAPVGSVVVEALAAVAPGGTVAVNAIHLDQIPAFPYELLWGERIVRSVANVTRSDAREFLEMAGSIGVRTEVTPYRLDQANEALADLASGTVDGAAVLVC